MQVSFLGKRTHAVMSSVVTNEPAQTDQSDINTNQDIEITTSKPDGTITVSSEGPVNIHDVQIFENGIYGKEGLPLVVEAENSGVVFFSPIEMLGSKITGLGSTVSANDAASKAYVDAQVTSKLSLSGGTMTGPINMDQKAINGLPTPLINSDAATKAYVDAANALQLNLAGGTMTGALVTGANKISSTGFCLPWTQWVRTTTQTAQGAIVWSTVDGSPEYYQSTATDPNSTHTMMVGANGSQMRFTSGFYLFMGTFQIRITQPTPAVAAETVTVLFRDGSNIHIRVDDIIPFGSANTISRTIPFIGIRSNAGNTVTFRMEWNSSNLSAQLEAARLCIFRIN